MFSFSYFFISEKNKHPLCFHFKTKTAKPHKQIRFRVQSSFYYWIKKLRYHGFHTITKISEADIIDFDICLILLIWSKASLLLSDLRFKSQTTAIYKLFAQIRLTTCFLFFQFLGVLWFDNRWHCKQK